MIRMAKKAKSLNLTLKEIADHKIMIMKPYKL
jgi:hypothetical protein